MVATQTIHLEPGSYRLDVHEFMSLIKACRQHSHRQLGQMRHLPPPVVAT